MTLLELKNQFLKNEISIMKLAHSVKQHQQELDSLYPYQGPVLAKFWAYVYDSQSVYCTISGRFKTFEGMQAGFRKFCGNQTVCHCNREQMQLARASRTPDQIAQSNQKRKVTNRQKYGADFASQLPETKQKTAQTCLDRYGAIAPTCNPTILQKSTLTCQTNHGVEWPQQNQEIYLQTVETFRQKLGVDRPAQAPGIRQQSKERERSRGYQSIIDNLKHVSPLFDQETYCKGNFETEFDWRCNQCQAGFKQTKRPHEIPRCLTCQPLRESWGETVLKKWLMDHNIDFVQWDRQTIKPFELDFLIPHKQLAIEFNGTWHHREHAVSSRAYHQQKYKLCDQQGIKLIQIWEHELAHKPSIIFDRLSHAMGLTPNKIAARKCRLIELDHSQAKSFFDSYHLQGYQQAKVSFGLMREDQLVSAASFSKNRFGHSAEFELVRSATAAGIQVQGGLSRLVSHAQQQLGFASLVSYANLNWGKGLGYQQAGFVLDHISKPNYWYFRGLNEIHSRVRFQKHKIVGLAPGNSEKQIAQNMGYSRFFDAGNAVWIRRW